jgi:sporulation integral membrane protein YtvI
MVLTIYLFMLAFSYLYRIATPIFFAFVIFLVIEPLAKFLNKRGIKKSIASAISTLVFILIIVGAMAGLGVIFTVQLQQLMLKLPEYAAILQQQLIANTANLQDKLISIDTGLLEKASEYTATITQKATAIATGLMASLFAAVTTFSTFVVNLVIGVILAYFLSLEIDTWKRLAEEKTPNTFKTAFQFLRENVLKGIVTYIKAQLKLILLTFLIIFVALVFLGVKNAFSIALLSAFFDVLPLLGVSTVFIPWIIYLLVVGKTTLAIWLACLLAVVLGTRQILEPKITGDSLGVSAFTMLSFMIVSLSLFGVAGLILSPILIILIKALYEQGYLQKWIRKPQDYDLH